MPPTVDLPASLHGAGTLVSVIVPTYGDAEHIPPALESIGDQTHDNVEIVIVDSTGVDWLERLAENTEGVTYVFQEPSGLAAARNHGIEVASGDVVGFLDADDRWASDKLSKQLPLISDGADVVYSDAWIVENGEKRYLTSLPIDDPETHYLDFLFEGGVPIPAVLARRECLDREPFNEDLPAVEDRNLLVRLFREFIPGRVPEPLAYYHRRPDSMSSDAEVMYQAELRSLSALFERYDGLAQYRPALERKARYKYGKRLLRTGHPGQARRELYSVLRDGSRDLRAVGLLAISLLPHGNVKTLKWMERLQERL